jgi:ribosomal protein S18 acetylase RimI-like enzyme
MDIRYKIKTAVAKDILVHLAECSENFSPPLMKRVDLEEYSGKLFEKSVTFEAWKEFSLVGLIAVYFNEFDSSAFITNVSVLRNFMGLGVASKLLEQCIEYAARKSFEEIKLEVNAESIYAIKLYGKFDFTVDSVNGDFLIMKLKLNK